MKVVDFFGIKKKSKIKQTKVKVKPVQFIGNPKPIKQKFPSKKNMNWFQAKRKYPHLNPFKDADKDGLMNMYDCKPFNKKKKDVPHNPSPVQAHSSQPLGRPALPGENYAGKPTDPRAPIIQSGTKILAGPGAGTTTHPSTTTTTQTTVQIPAQTQAPVKSQAQVSIPNQNPLQQVLAQKGLMSPQQTALSQVIQQSQGQKQSMVIKEIPQNKPSPEKLYGGMTADQRFTSTTEALKQAGDLNKPTARGIITTAAYYTKPAFTTADPFKVNTALTYAGQLIQSIPGSKLTGYSPQEAAQKRQDIMKRAYTEYSYDSKTGKEIGKIEPGMTVAQRVGAVLEPAYKTSVGQNLIVTAAALPIGYAVGTVLKSAPVVVSSVLPEKTVEAGIQALSSPVGQAAIKTVGAGALTYAGYKTVAEPTIRAAKAGLPSGEVLGTAVTKGLGYGGALALGAEGTKLGLKYGTDILEASKQAVTGKIPVYHGTTEANFKSMQKEGIKPGTYLATSKEEAEQFLKTRFGNENVASGEGLKIVKTYVTPQELKQMTEASRDAGNILTLNKIDASNIKGLDVGTKASTLSGIPLSDKGGTLLSDKSARLEALSSSSSKFDQMMSQLRTPEERIRIIEQAFKDYLKPEQKAAITKAVAQEVSKLK